MSRTILLLCLVPFIHTVSRAQDGASPAPPIPTPRQELQPQQEPKQPEPDTLPGTPLPAGADRDLRPKPLPTLPQPPAAAVTPGPAQGITAMEALRRLTERFGKEAFSLLIEMAGPDGQTQPDSWKVVVVDLSSPFLARTFTVDSRSVADMGENRDFYPDNIPAGFIAIGKLAVGSYDAFIALDKEAGEAKIGFDSIQYRLHAREGSNAPVWTMTALDRDGFPVGIVDVSGTTGKVLRTVWFRRAGSRTLPTVEDSELKKALRP